jgi:2-octaprenyl-6-methoxyphenol hydroxylase
MKKNDASQQRSGRKNSKGGNTRFDVIIVGGGPAGLTLTALLAANGIRAACIDRETPAAQADAAFDGRTIAVSYGSRKVFRAAGIWDALEGAACPIETIEITDGDSPVLLAFDKSEAGGRIFGWIAEIRDIRAALFGRVAKLENATHIAPAQVKDFRVDADSATAILADGRAFSAPLLIGADGRNSFTREWMGIGTRGWAYRQRAIVCTVRHENPHDHIAIENFRPEGPFAILPMTDEGGGHRSSIVWTEHGAGAQSFMDAPQDVFDAALQARFPARYGKVAQLGKRYSYPLGLIHAHQYIGPRMALVAEAGHGIHPIAGQGLNMGLRDVAEIAGLILAAHARGEDIGGDALLQRYQRARRFDNMAMGGTTDLLNRLFSNDSAPVRAARRAGLRAVAKLPFARRFFMEQAMGTSGLLPALIRDNGAETEAA